MASGSEADRVKLLIDTYYKLGRSGGWSRDVNEEVAKIFGIMLEETKECTTALNWVPRPPGGKATISWLARTFTRALINQLRDELSATCVQFTIRNWNMKMQMAAAGV